MLLPPPPDVRRYHRVSRLTRLRDMCDMSCWGDLFLVASLSYLGPAVAELLDWSWLSRTSSCTPTLNTDRIPRVSSGISQLGGPALVGSGGLPIMHCAPNLLSKIGIDVRNRRLCDLLQGRIQDFPSKVRSIGTLHS